MSENPLQALFQTFVKISNSVQTHLSNLIGQPHHPSSPTAINPLLSFSFPSKSKVNPSNTDSAASLQPKHILDKGKSASPVTKEDLGRATWTFLHTLPAQYPDNPTRQQKKDVKELMAILSRMYPCKECADHFKEVLRLDLMLNFPNGYVMCIILSTEALANWYSHANELMQGGVSWSVSSVHVIYWAVQQNLGKKNIKVCWY
ncbi:FAD-linked sulfhydryl oxidase ERV1-like isoform X2 [Castanea sativa]|uniref:FAD-linked sulfhydryl oxidase ERV1-like isoform X2 n=1 Tax=Castanea sativa TaxID=21020 RepID=UPI003F64FA8B